MAGVPFKVSVPGIGRSGLQVGIVASSLKHLGQILEERLGLSQHAQIYLEDGTLVCDQDYFELLEPQTKLTVVEGRDELQECSLGEKRPLVAPADSATSLPPTKQRRTSRSAWSTEAFDSLPLISNTSGCNNNLVSCLRISRVEENVPMQESPSRTCKPRPYTAPLKHSYPVMSPPHHVMLPPHNPHSIASLSQGPPPHAFTIVPNSHPANSSHHVLLDPHSIAPPSHDPPPLVAASPQPITIVPNSYPANPRTLHYQPFPDPFNHQQILFHPQTPSHMLHPQPSHLIPVPRPQHVLLPQPCLVPVQTYQHMIPPLSQSRPTQHGSLPRQPVHQQVIQHTRRITATNCNQQSGEIRFPRLPTPKAVVPPELLSLPAHNQPPVQREANQVLKSQHKVPTQPLPKPVVPPEFLLQPAPPSATVQRERQVLKSQRQAPMVPPELVFLPVPPAQQEANQQQVLKSQHQVPMQLLPKPIERPSPLTLLPTAHHQTQTPLPKESALVATTPVHLHSHNNNQSIPPAVTTASTPIPGVRAVVGAAQCPVAVLCSDLESGEESDDEDKLCIVEDLESTASGETCNSTFPLSTTSQRMVSPVTIDRQQTPDNDIMMEPPVVTNPMKASSLLSNALRKSSSLDDGYSSSTSFSSLTSMTNRLPFADFDTGSIPESPLTPDCPCEADFQLWEDQAIKPTSPKCDDEVFTDCVDVGTEEHFHRETGSERSVEEVSPTNEEVELLVSIPVQWENGRLLCQDDSVGEEEVVAASQSCAEDGVELMVSIPVCWEDHQLKYITLGNTSVDEVVGPCPEVCIPGEHSNPSEEVSVPVLDEQVVVVEEYACEETVLSTCSPQVCSEIDIDRCVAQIMSMVLMLQSEESEDVCGGIEELAVSIPIEYEPVPPCMQVRDLPLDVGNEVIVSCEEDLGDDEMAEVCLDFPHVEEVEIEVVDLMDVHEYSTGAPDLLPLSVKKRLFTEKINHLLHIADALSEEDSREIRGFFSSTSLDPGKGIQRYTLMQRSHDAKYVHLELNFATGKWRGIIS